ncbi:hypothetical protein GLIP_3552 [Aliiglaciecola lipolytica E3]|uniref:Uncharacterized protein n=1 Tax=Aliiglaciecola lipolytica E3 TaxID=1127673 RepID=K6X6B5_9ALTE|nr:hypothetical protein GLIP_3552 [Aliiglaciecola lipolytica E3]
MSNKKLRGIIQKFSAGYIVSFALKISSLKIIQKSHQKNL